MCLRKCIISIYQRIETDLMKYVSYIVFIIYVFGGTLSAQNRNIDISIGTVVDSVFFNKVDSMINYNRFKDDPVFYLQILKKQESEWGPYVQNIQSVNDLSDTIYIYVSPKQTINNKIDLNQVIVNYSGRLYVLPQICENSYFRIIGIKKFRYDKKVERIDMDNNFFKKQQSLQLLRYINGNISEEPKSSSIYRAAKE